MHVNGHRSPCHTVNAKAGTQYQKREACEDIAYAYNNEVFQLKTERLDADDQPSEVWTYYCRVSHSKEPSVITDVSAATGLPVLSTPTERLVKPWRAN